MLITQPFTVTRRVLGTREEKQLQFRNTRRKNLVDFLSTNVAKMWSDDWREGWRTERLPNGNTALKSGNVLYEVELVTVTEDGLAL